MSGRPGVRPGRFDDAGDGDDLDREPDDRPARRPMAMEPYFNDLDLRTRSVLRGCLDGGPPGVGMVVRGWYSVALALGCSPRTAQRMEATGELVVAHERTPGGRGRVWCSVAEVVNVARRRAGLPPWTPEVTRLADEATDRAIDRAAGDKRNAGIPGSTPGEPSPTSGEA